MATHTDLMLASRGKQVARSDIAEWRQLSPSLHIDKSDFNVQNYSFAKIMAKRKFVGTLMHAAPRAGPCSGASRLSDDILNDTRAVMANKDHNHADP